MLGAAMWFGGLVIVAHVSAAAGSFAAESDASSPSMDEAAPIDAATEAEAVAPETLEGGSPEADEDALGGDPECDRLFGNEEDREVNEASREQQLILVEDGPSYIDVVQTGGWTEPAEIAFRGLSLKDTVLEGQQPLAVIEVDEELGFCEVGEYEVQVDDAVGANGRILAILPGLLLLEYGDELRYVRAQSYRGRPTFKVSWRSPFSVVVESKSSGRSSKRSVRRRRRRR